MAKKKKENKEKPAHLIARAKAKFEIYTVKEPCELLDFLMKSKEGANRTTAKSLLSKRLIFVDNVITTQYNFPLKPGMKVQVSKSKGEKELRNSMLKVLYEDAYLIVVEKKSGLLAVGAPTKRERSAHSILTEHVQRSSRHRKVYLVHRLDKEASGILIFAKDEKTKLSIQDHWRDVVKELRYVAVLSGDLEKENGVICSWMNDGKLYVSHSQLGNSNEDKAITYYKTIKRANGYSLVELETDKKNQIRMHMKELHHPIVGDLKFGDGNDPIKRLALHSFKLSFRHPVTKQAMEFETPYPSVFKKIMLRTNEE